VKQGLFLSLDGIDGCGKSTQSERLVEWLRGQGLTVTSCNDPGGTALGNQLRAILLSRRGTLAPHPGELALAAEALLFMASRAQLVAEVIRPALSAGEIVVSDRFLLANVVYQGHAGGLESELLWQAGRLSTGGLEPDLTLVLDLPLEVARTRRNRPADRVESRDEAYHQRVREGFLIEARRAPDRIKVIDASLPVEAVQAQIREEVSRVLATGPGA
jgi:dTMP kinase